MFWDILITFIAFAAQCVTAYAAWRVTLNPVAQDDKVRRLKYEFIIWTSFAVGAISLISGGIRGGDLHSELSDIKRGQQTTNAGIQDIKNNPPIVNVNTPPAKSPVPAAQVVLEKFESSYTTVSTINGVATPMNTLLVAGKPVSQNFFFINTGSASADGAVGFGRVYIGTEREGSLLKRFKDDLAKAKPNAPGTIEVGGRDEFWFTATSENSITQDDIDKLSDGKESLYIFVNVTYRDPNGRHYAHYCRVLQTPPKDQTIQSIWHFCDDWSDRH
jgi:hypothetical protein